MMIICIDAGNDKGTGDGLLTKGKRYLVLGTEGGYYVIRCDDGVTRTKLKTRFKPAKRIDAVSS